MTQQRFVFEVPEADLQDLRARLGRTRWPIPWPATGWEAGTDAAELHRLGQVWGSDFDWRAQEAALNALPSHMASIDGTAVHFLRFDGEDPDALPIVLTHGWPSSFLELTDLARRLEDIDDERRRILDGEHEVKIMKQWVPVRCRVAKIGGFSAHADWKEVLRWLEGMQQGVPSRTFLTHGEPEAANAMAAHIKERFGWNVEVPQYAERFELV